ncbi:MAG: hypothetical protein D6738_01810 [Acidobacteria bacterium]|nr:MAG: hypothetical protein D6738_01810 [Acidobacteriota bacterium]
MRKGLVFLFLLVLVAGLAAWAMDKNSGAITKDRTTSCTSVEQRDLAAQSAVEQILRIHEFNLLHPEKRTDCPDFTPCGVLSGCSDGDCTVTDTGVNIICDGAAACPGGQTVHIKTCTCERSDPNHVCFDVGRYWFCQ